MADPNFSGSELAQWLQEAGRRRPTPPPEPQPSAEAQPPRPARRRPYIFHTRELLLIAVAALAFMPYFFADVHVQIYRLKHLIAFVLPDLN